MRQPQHKNRMRARNRRQPNPINRIYESNGPDVKIRGTAQHVAEKYMQLGRDALSSGDEIKAESYFQHAEHYYRIIAAAQEQIQQRRQQQEQRMRGNGRSRSAPSPVAAVPAPESAPALPAPDNGSDGGNGAAPASEPVEETALRSEAAETGETLTVIDVSEERIEAGGNGQDANGNGMREPEPVVQVVDLTDTGAVDETGSLTAGNNGKDGDGARLEAAEDWGSNPPGFLMQPVSLSDLPEDGARTADGDNGAALPEATSADTGATSGEKTAEAEDKTKRTRRTRAARTTRRTRRTTRKTTSSGDTAGSDSASAGEA